MRKYTEPSCRHLLRQPLIFGVPFPSLLALSAGTVGLQIAAFGDSTRSAVGLGASVLAYGGLRGFARFAKVGWDQSILFALERISSNKKGGLGKITELASDIEVVSPDTLDETALLSSKQLLEEELKHLLQEQAWIVKCNVDEKGARLSEIKVEEACDRLKKKSDLDQIVENLTGLKKPYVYSLYQVPVSTDPLWLFSQLKDLGQNYQVIASFRGLDQSTVKKRIEGSRRFNAPLNDLSQVDADISFEEASHVLRGLSKGDECVVEMSLILISDQKLPLDPHYFLLEKKPYLPILSAFALRARFHRSHLVRAVTASDLTPHILDPQEDGAAILKTLRGKPLYFDPQDSRLDALHWLVSGATGTGKSFLVGLILWRMIREGRPMSVLFMDHKRGFRRLVKATEGTYIEPDSIHELKSNLDQVFFQLNQKGAMCGVEFSDLGIKEKGEAAAYVIQKTAEFLGKRSTSHVVYVVLDECWAFLKEDPQGVQQAFRVFRKLDAGAIAITQSIRDFISDETGQSIIQNADITILLRQKEDVTRYQNILDLTDPEMSKVKQIKKKKGVYSECLIKTPFFSRFGRLYPTEEEHELLRTDNLRKERFEKAREVHRTGGLNLVLFLFGLFISASNASASLFGEETLVLMNVVSNQLVELQHLAEGVGVSKQQRDLLLQINEGVDKTTSQIRTLEDIIARAQGVDPTAVRSLADLNQSIDDMKFMSYGIQELLVVKLLLCDQAVDEASLQSDTAYKMGQEMASVGSQLATESKTASPGRAQQITASASSAQMLAMGVQLQTMAQIAQLLALDLDLRKSEIQKNLKLEEARKAYLGNALSNGRSNFKSNVKSAPKRRRRI